MSKSFQERAELLTGTSLQTSPGLWPPQDSLDPLNVSPVTQVFNDDDAVIPVSPTEMSTGRWSSKDAESGAARSHPFYHASPQADGFFHCPFEGKEGCDHKPEALKCNYRLVDVCSPTVCLLILLENILILTFDHTAARTSLVTNSNFLPLPVYFVTSVRLMVCMAMEKTLSIALIQAASVPNLVKAFLDGGIFPTI